MSCSEGEYDNFSCNKWQNKSRLHVNDGKITGSSLNNPNHSMASFKRGLLSHDISLFPPFKTDLVNSGKVEYKPVLLLVL